MALLCVCFGLLICGYSLNSLTVPSLQQKITRKPVVWVHIHKSGGSTVCEAARRNRERTALGDVGNCNFLSDDVGLFYKDSPVLKPPTCEERMQKVRAQSVTWMQIEREFNKGDFCEGSFLYATSLRDPAMLAQSLVNYNAIGTDYKKCLEQPAEHCADKTVMQVTLPGMEASEPAWLYFDNFMTRVLCGHDVMMLPPGAINATHEKMALDVLAKFDLVVRLEDFGKNATVELFRKTFGWSDLEVLTEHENSAVHPITFSAEDHVRYKELNQHDYEIYKYYTV